MAKASAVAKVKSVKTEPVKKVVTRVSPATVEQFKQEKLVETVKEEPIVEKKEEKKETMKKTTEKKTAIKKTTEKKNAVGIQEEIFIEFDNQQILTSSVVEKVKEAYIAEGHAADSITKVRAYIKPEENMIYYVVNDDYASGISLY